MDNKSTYSAESAGGLMVTKVLIGQPQTTVAEIIKRIAKESWEDIHNVYVLSPSNTLLGKVRLKKILAVDQKTKLIQILDKIKISVSPTTDQEKVVIEAVRNDVKSIPVVDRNNHLLGIVTADKIIDVLHMEHLEDFLRFSGIRGRGSRIVELISARIFELVGSRFPWLFVGLLVGFVVSITTSRFERALAENIALVFFLPIIAYMSDAIGTQTETIFIRALTLFKINLYSYILREGIVGLIIGTLLGFISAVFAFILSGSHLIAIVVGLSLVISLTIASVLACITPLVLRSLNKDPAIGSGPFTTAIQDFISVLVYLSIASVVLS